MERYNFGLNWENTKEESFISFLKQACEKRKFSFLWVHKENIESVVKKLEKGKLRIDVFLDGEGTFNKKDDLYARACYAVKDSNGIIINDPDRTRTAIDKSVSHFELANAGVQTPYTVIMRNWESGNFKLTSFEKEKLGNPFIIKPAFGYGQKGLNREATGSKSEIATARSFDPDDHFLLQKKIVPITFNKKRAWFRVLHVFNTIIPCWWDDQQNLYTHISSDEFKDLNFQNAIDAVVKIAQLSQMSWFSTEIALEKIGRKNRFIAVDYINDQCDLTTQTESPGGVPNNIVRYITKKIVDVAYRCISNKEYGKKYTVFLKDAKIKLKSTIVPPTLLKNYNV